MLICHAISEGNLSRYPAGEITMTIDAKVALPLIGDVLKEALPVMGELVKAIAPLLQPFADAAAKKIAGDEESASKPIEFSLTPEPEKKTLTITW